MFKRHFILLGAGTTAGGTVKAASSARTLNGVPFAMEGDPVDCPACGRQGIIKAVPPRLEVLYKGRHFALEHDLCRCGCHPPPKMVANQHQVYETIRGADGMGDALAAVDAHIPASSVAEKPAPLQLVRESDEQPFRNRRYILELPGRTIEGVSDADGFTQPLTAAERDALIAWHVEDSGL